MKGLHKIKITNIYIYIYIYIYNYKYNFVLNVKFNIQEENRLSLRLVSSRSTIYSLKKRNDDVMARIIKIS